MGRSARISLLFVLGYESGREWVFSSLKIGVGLAALVLMFKIELK